MNLSYRSAGGAAITSGIIGILAFGFLIMFLMIRSQDPQQVIILVRIHDFCVILQFLFLIPVVFALFELIQERSPNTSRAMLNVGIGALSFTALFLLLNFTKVIADVLYMFPQGVFGVWIMIACWRMKGLMHQWLRWFGIIVGFGLVLVGIFPLGFAIFVDNIILHIPSPTDEEYRKIAVRQIPANIFIHKILWIGSFMGVLTLPIWTILVGVRLLKEETKQLSI